METELSFDRFIEKQRFVILDGGLATHLEGKYGQNLRDSLWSARLLCENPDVIRQTHVDFYEAGADVATTASYQGSIEGFMTKGYSKDEAVEFLRRSVRLAAEARDIVWKKICAEGNPTKRLRPLVAASIGSYGAFLANGAEYTGDFGNATDEMIYNYHDEKIEAMSKEAVDVYACETIPSIREARILATLFAEKHPTKRFWVSFTCKTNALLSSGESLLDAYEALHGSEQMIGIGSNCSHPETVQDALSILNESIPKESQVALVAYPNSGEDWDSAAHQWMKHTEPSSPVTQVALRMRDITESKTLRPLLIGGCCRVGPDSISSMRLALIDSSQQQQP